MFALNIGLAIFGVIISLSSAIFWSKVRRSLGTKSDSGSISRTILNRNVHTYNFVDWLYQHKSKFDILVGGIVTIIEFFALIPF
jgi:hypothetical protein